MAKREEEKSKRAEDPEEEGGLDASGEQAEEDEEREDEQDESEEDESENSASDDEEAEDEKAAASDDEEEEARTSSPGEEGETAGDAKAAAAEEEDDAPPAQLGAQRYVMSAFFGGALLVAYLLGRAIDGIWLKLVTRDWLVERAPFLAAVPDDDKALYATIAGGVIALLLAVRTARNPEVRQWSDDVSGELLKVKWPSRKEVYASTVVVLTTSAVAVVYLFLLDRFWGFVTNQIYGTGL